MSKIIVVDDETNIRNLCYEAFKQDGHTVLTVPRGDEVLKLLREEPPDLILMDLHIPGEEGVSLLKRIPTQGGKGIPVVIFSGFVTAELEKQAYEAGAIEVVRKEVSLSELRNKIKRILSAKHQIFQEPRKESRGQKVLLVDDEGHIRNLLKTFFEKKGFLTLTAKDGEEALLLVQKEHPDVILLDVTMPGMDGILTLKKIRELDPNVGVVMATALQDEEMVQEAMQLGAYAYVLKPFDLQYLELVALTRLKIASA